MGNSIFCKSSLEKISSPEHLNEYVKVTSGGVWLLMIALFSLVIAVGIWAFTGTIPETVQIKGIAYQSNSSEQIIYAYVPIGDAKRMKIDMNVQISPEYAPREEYGYIAGTVSYIGETPVKETDLKQTFDSLQLVSTILPPGNPVEIQIKYKSVDGKIQWSNKKGEAVTISNGSFCNVFVITKERKPYELLLR